MAAGQATRLPSEEYELGSLRPLGYQVSPSSDHVQSSSRAAISLASELTSSGHDPPALHLKIHHAVNDVLVTPQLFGFAIVDPDFGQEEPDGFAWAAVVNQSVPLQIESTIAFVFQLIERQALSARFQSGQGPETVLNLQNEKVQTDSKGLTLASEELRFGWRHAAASARAHAEEMLGGRIDVVYEPDPFPHRERLEKRWPFLEAAYNNVRPLSEAIDRMVAAVAQSTMRVSTIGPGVTRDLLQSMATSSATKYVLAQVVRDSQVYGNGYLAFTKNAPIGPYCVKPSKVLHQSGKIYVDGEPFDDELNHNITHFTGVNQILSPYGLSILEPFMTSFRVVQVMQDAIATADEIAEQTRPDQDAHHWALAMRTMAEGTIDEHVARFESMLWFPLEHLARAELDLYFPGYEKLE